MNIEHHQWNTTDNSYLPLVPLYEHYNNVIMKAKASQITGFSFVSSTVGPGADQIKHQCSASLAFCVGNSPVTGEFPAQRASNAENVPFYDVIMNTHYKFQLQLVLLQYTQDCNATTVARREVTSLVELLIHFSMGQLRSMWNVSPMITWNIPKFSVTHLSQAHYNDFIMAMASQITSLKIVYSAVYSCT